MIGFPVNHTYQLLFLSTMGKPKAFTGTSAEDFKAQKASLDNKISLCLTRAELLRFLSNDLNVHMVRFLWDDFGLRVSRTIHPSKRLMSIDICDLKFPVDPTIQEAPPPVDLNSFGGGGLAAAIEFADTGRCGCGLRTVKAIH